jgi:hypothetical protein
MAIKSCLKRSMQVPLTRPQTVPVMIESFTYSRASRVRLAPIMLPTKTEKDIERAIGKTWKIEIMLMLMC